MSTIKSSAENLTLNADGANNDVIIQSNGSTKVTVDGQNSRLGIGTTAPDTELHVHGTGTLLSSDSYFVAQIQTDRNDNGSSDDAILQFVNGSGKTVKGEIRWDESSNTFELGHGDNQGHLVIANNGQVTTSGDLIVGADVQLANGRGISFANMPNASGMTSELLDDYEEGTFTATLTSSTAPSSPPTTTGTYIKIGRLVHFSIYRFDDCNTSGASGQIRITGLPFSEAGDVTIVPVPFSHGFNFGVNYNQMFVLGDSTVLYGYESRNGDSWADWAITAGTGKYLAVQGTYQTT